MPRVLALSKPDAIAGIPHVRVEPATAQLVLREAMVRLEVRVIRVISSGDRYYAPEIRSASDLDAPLLRRERTLLFADFGSSPEPITR